MVTLGHCSGNPGLVFQIPRYGLSDPLGKARARMPAKFRFEPGCIHGITVVVPRSVSDKLDQRAGGSTACPGVCRTDRVKEALATIKRCNVANTFCGAINFARPDGTTLDPDDPVAAYGTHSMFAAEVLVQSMTYMYEGEVEFGVELARRSLENLVCRQRHTWDNPCIVKGKSGERLSGHEYYQNMLIWALPACMSGQDLAGPCQPGGLVDRIVRAAAK